MQILNREQFIQIGIKKTKNEKMIADLAISYPTLNCGWINLIDIIEEGQDKGQDCSSFGKRRSNKDCFCRRPLPIGGNDHGIIRELEKSDLAFDGTTEQDQKIQ